MGTKQAYSGDASRTYQSDSVVRAPRRPAPRHSQKTPRHGLARYPVVTWLNLACLDAPLVSITWLWLFAHAFQIALRPLAVVALFLTAWLIYLADRLADSRSLSNGAPRSLRHEFCSRNQRAWIGLLIGIAVLNAIILFSGLGVEIISVGSVIGAFALIHLILNYSLGGAWPPLPLKEVAIGTLFAAGTLVPLFPGVQFITAELAFSVAAFAVLCTLNCISIAFWERELDDAQGKVSFATRFPALRSFWGKILIAFAITFGFAGIMDPDIRPIFVCVSTSSLLLAALDLIRTNLQRDEQTALADLVLLTPLLAFCVLTG